MSKFISTNVDGKIVTFTDVLQSEWYATYIFDAMKAGILSGYRGEDGAPLGKFGPENTVTVAELAKMAHKIADVDTLEEGVMEGPWYTPYVRSAQRNHWLIYLRPELDPERPATRGEVLATLLQVLDVPRNWPKGEMFADVAPDLPYASEIETAAAEGIVSGEGAQEGGSKAAFHPMQPVNRAEVAKILVLAIQKYKATQSKAVPK